MTNFHLRKGLGGEAKKSNKNSTKATFSTESQQTRDVPDQMLLAEKDPSAGDAPAKQCCRSEPGAQQVSRALVPRAAPSHSPGAGRFLLPPSPQHLQGDKNLWLAGTIPSPPKGLLTALVPQGC